MTKENRQKVHGYLERVAARNAQRKEQRSLARKRVTVLKAMRGHIHSVVDGRFLLTSLGLPIEIDSSMGVTRLLSPGMPAMVFHPLTGIYMGKEFGKRSRKTLPPDLDQLPL